MPDMPEWVHVWFWMRFLRDPQDMTPLPQQDDRNPESMTIGEYDARRREWIGVGGPTTSARQLVAAMSGSIVEPEDDDGIPF